MWRLEETDGLECYSEARGSNKALHHLGGGAYHRARKELTVASLPEVAVCPEHIAHA